MTNANSLNNLTVDTAVLQRIALFYAHTIISGVVALELYPVKENTQNNTQDCTTVDNERMIATLMLMDRFRDELHTAMRRCLDRMMVPSAYVAIHQSSVISFCQRIL